MLCNPLVCCFPEDPEVKKSRDLDRNISLWMKQYRKAIKLLLLGNNKLRKRKKKLFILFN